MKTLHLLAPIVYNSGSGAAPNFQPALDQGKKTDLGFTPNLQDAIDNGHPNRATKLFCGSSNGCFKTAREFCRGLGYAPKIMPTVTGLGEENMPRAIRSDLYARLIEEGTPELSAIMEVGGPNDYRRWCDHSFKSLHLMFAALKDGEIGIGFVHKLPIKLFAQLYWANPATRKSYIDVRPLEGFIFQSDTKKVLATEKIGV